MDYLPRKLSSLSEQEKQDILKKIIFMRRFSSYSPGMIARKFGLTIRDMEKLTGRQSDELLRRDEEDVGKENNDLGELGLSELRIVEPEGNDDGTEMQIMLGVQSRGHETPETDRNQDGMQ